MSRIFTALGKRPYRTPRPAALGTKGWFRWLLALMSYDEAKADAEDGFRDRIKEEISRAEAGKPLTLSVEELRDILRRDTERLDARWVLGEVELEDFEAKQLLRDRGEHAALERKGFLPKPMGTRRGVADESLLDEYVLLEKRRGGVAAVEALAQDEGCTVCAMRARLIRVRRHIKRVANPRRLPTGGVKIDPNPFDPVVVANLLRGIKIPSEQQLGIDR